ncbi:ABC transporter ATP-binding protein [Nesterenkonia sp. MY13]|uniref:ABC transporter ATP-binding protein n=1 Tax=Nesterenkonia sedimenti TaxID=1463632 RepID=A0A7X8TKX4_9MICC|nr:ABC transporter ATP-binding protein [Nesterenkonia sedimenti]NLS10489.1 ABC transporter ATP-binding protein [Nesterenkonia sedimenti]
MSTQPTEQTETPVVEVEGLSISYSAGTRMVPVTREVSFTLAAGETVALVGESGSGKTTVATSLLGALRPGSQIVNGAVRIEGEDVFALDAEKLRALRGGRVALVAQNAGHALTPSMRVGTQIAEALAAHGLDSSAEKVQQLGRRVHLDDPELLRRYPHELSGGQQQRVAIAMAIAAEPKVLVLDEPTTALDVITQRAILDLIAELRAELGVAVVLVSHDLGVVAEIADTSLVMQDGDVVETGPTAEVLSAPAHEYTRKLVAAAPKLKTGGAASTSTEPGSVEPLPATEPVLSCQGLSIRYKRSAPLAVDGFAAEIGEGQTLAVVGQSGSGKSTVAAALAGLLPAERGTISFSTTAGEGEGADLLKPAGKRSLETRRAVQLVFQNADLALNPRRTVGDAIARPLKYFSVAKSRSEIQDRVGALLEEVGLDPSYARRLPAQLSGGQRQRIGIARALAAEPRLLIADEITTALDVSVQAEVLDLLADLQKRRGLSCLFISHDLAVVQRVADHVVVMKDGVVVEQGPVETILTYPQQPYTRQLLEATVHIDAA